MKGFFKCSLLSKAPETALVSGVREGVNRRRRLEFLSSQVGNTRVKRPGRDTDR
jgi:hypothetical protein